jgi:hypothetical protein
MPGEKSLPVSLHVSGNRIKIPGTKSALCETGAFSFEWMVISIMKSRRLVLVLALTWCLSAAGAIAQSIPIKALFVGKQTDVKGQQFLEAIRSTIQQSSRFSIYDGQLDELPANGVAIYIYSIQVESADSHAPMGSAMVIQSMRQSHVDRGYFKQVYQETWMFAEDQPVADTVQKYMSTLSERLKHLTAPVL